VTHPEFVAAYRSGSIGVHVDRAAAARYVSARLLLPFVMLPLLGLGVALALTGWVWTGLAVIGAATLARLVIRRSAAHFVITQAIQDAKFYDDLAASGLLEIKPAEAPRPRAS
jgi:hypothetical protein